ncbi:hypothetical protein OBBRIDRAFT_544246 [Obba rivulosa]|uniref:Uncharacterized protein n=1 Tax=Obba rivulosa TaxID=1052685 RepID=A0A8E2AVA2_9APHY|nr:hypothetical protein OBBRIDRAFT_544246 [Obba rivulosa]
MPNHTKVAIAGLRMLPGCTSLRVRRFSPPAPGSFRAWRIPTLHQENIALTLTPFGDAAFRRFRDLTGRARLRQPPKSPKRVEKRAKPMRYSPDVGVLCSSEAPRRPMGGRWPFPTGIRMTAGRKVRCARRRPGRLCKALR